MFISLCGLEGASKTTSMSTVINACKQAGFNVVSVREPGGTVLAEKIRDLHKADHDEVVHPETEMMLMFAARHQLYQNVIKPALDTPNTIVVSDRSWWCTYAYQVHDLISTEDQSLFFGLKDTVTKNMEHDAVLYLDVTPEIGIQRARGREALDRIENKDITFFHRAQQGYRHLLDTHPHADVINADMSHDEVQAAVKLWIENKLESYAAL